MKLREIALGLFLSIFLFSQIACGGDRIYSGRVIDADTKEPIEGAAVVAIWDGERATIAGPSTRHQDVKEALTDKDGRWSIWGPEGDEGKIIPTLLHYVMIPMTRRPYFIVFKPGYCPWPGGFAIDNCKGRLIPPGNIELAEGKTVELPMLTDRDDRVAAQRISPVDEAGKETIFRKKQTEFIRLLNQEREYLELEPYKITEE